MSFWTDQNIHPKIKSRFIVTLGTGFFLPNVKTITKPAVEISTKEYRLMNHFFNYPGLVKWQPIKITFVDMNGTLRPDRAAGGFAGIDAGNNKPFDTASMLYEMLTNSGYIHPTVDEHKLGKKSADGSGESKVRTPITTPEKASTIANSFGNGLYDATNYSPESPRGDSRTITIQQISFGRTEDRVRKLTGPGEPPKFGPDNSLPNAQTVEQWKLINPIITNISWGDLDYGSDDLVEYTIDIKYDWAEYEKLVDAPLVGNVYQTFGNL